MSVRKKRVLIGLVVLIVLAAGALIVYRCLPGISANTIACAGELDSDDDVNMSGYRFRQGELDESTHAVSYYMERWSYGELVSKTCIVSEYGQTPARNLDVGYTVDRDSGEHILFFGGANVPLDDPLLGDGFSIGTVPMLGRLGTKIVPETSIPLVCVCAWPSGETPMIPEGLSAGSDLAAVSKDIPALIVLSQVYGAECREVGEVVGAEGAGAEVL